MMITKAEFDQAIARHTMTVIRDEGMYRHLRFKAPETMSMHFDVITWPNYLCYTGDMGTYVFRRLTNMFVFFRRESKEYPIDKRYWAEKVEAADKSDGIKEFCFDIFKKNILDWIASHKTETTPDENASDEVRLSHQAAFEELLANVQDEVLTVDHNGVRAFDAANDFRHEGEAYRAYFGEKGTFEFRDFWETDNTQFTYRFVWCCFALEWAIDVYDAAKAPIPSLAA